MEEIQFFNYLFSIAAFVLSVISIWLAIQADKIKEDWQKEIKSLNERIRELNETRNGKR